jgi:hypothetical protein
MRLDLNMLLYASLFIILLGLFVVSLLRRRREETENSRDTATPPGAPSATPGHDQGDGTG